MEPDLMLAGKIAKHLTVSGPEAYATRISRNKRRQRQFLKRFSIPSPNFTPVTRHALKQQDIASCHFPAILKPTQAALSLGVHLLQNKQNLAEKLQEIQALSNDSNFYYFEKKSQYIALIEDFLPGEEVTVDGVVVNGTFVLGGIHNKRRNTGPTFEEDLYSLPFKTPEHEANIVAIATLICKHLKLHNSLFNVELRQDDNGVFKVVEFSNRMSGAFCYRHIRHVYSLDLVRLYCKSLLGLPIQENELLRKKPSQATCTKWVFGNGKVLANNAGDAKHSKHYDDYFQITPPGEIAGYPHGLNCLGRLSLHGEYRSADDVVALEKKSFEIMKQLNIEIESS
jgi:biotin carboxylase